MKSRCVFFLFNLLVIIIISMSTVSASMVYFNASSSDKYLIYQKPIYSKHWTEYSMYRIKNITINQDTYQIHKMYSFDLTKSNPGIKSVYTKNKTTLTNGGNWEKAIFINSSKKTFIGGCHGYEVYTSKKFYQDYKQFSPTTGQIVVCKNLKIVINSILLNPENPLNIIANTSTTYIWKGDSLIITNKYSWKKSVTILTAYAAMFPLSNAKTISSVGQLYGGHYQNLKLGDTLQRLNSPGGIFLNRMNDLRFSMKIINPEQSLFNYDYSGNTKTYFKVKKTYNKLYISLVSSPQLLNVYDGTIWSFTAEYKVWNQGLK